MSQYRELLEDLQNKIKEWALELQGLPRVPTLTKLIGEMIEISEDIRGFRIKELGEGREKPIHHSEVKK